MRELFYDLHIHSCLSPCGDNDMTPGNIAGMAYIKGLDVIALTDHNSCLNCGPAMKAAEEYGIICIPGMEINTMEEVHAVCLFRTLEAAMDFDSYVYKRLIKVKNKPDFFGHQYVYDYEDRIVREVEDLIINATEIPFTGLWELVRGYDGVMFPAHIDKSSDSLISNMGFIPEDSGFVTAEVKDLSKLHGLKDAHPYLRDCRIISDSDAHYLEHIHEAEHTILTEERTADSVIETLLTPVSQPAQDI